MNAQITNTPRARLLEVAEWLEAKTPLKAGVTSFNMHHWVEKNECGTSCCIAGAIVQFDQAANGQKAIRSGYINEISEDLSNQYTNIGGYAGDLCGLSPQEAEELFLTNPGATPAEAAATIRRFVDTGKLHWSADDDASESDGVLRSRQLPSKNSVLLGADGKPLAEGDTSIVAVLNTETGVVRAWKPFGNKQLPHEHAINAAAALPQLPGHTPWELAPKADLEQIADSGDGVHDVEQYPDMLDEFYWAKDLYRSSSDYAWDVSFESGSVNYSTRGDHSRALAVCRPLPASQQ